MEGILYNGLVVDGMSIKSKKYFESDRTVIDERVLSELVGFEKKSVIEGTIVDVATIGSDDPFEKLDVYIGDITPESRKLVETIHNNGLYESCFIVCVEIDSEDIIANIFTYQNSGIDKYPPIESLAVNMNVDVSSIHHLSNPNKKVQLGRENDRWKIISYGDQNIIRDTVTRKDALTPLIIGAFMLPASFFFISQVSELPFVLSGVLSTITSIIVGLVVAYGIFARKRDHDILLFDSLFRGINELDNEEEKTKIHDDSVSEVRNAEFKRVITTVDEGKNVNKKELLRNVGVVVNIPELSEEKIVRIPCPTSIWNNATLKRTLYTITATVNRLDTAQGRLIPITTDTDGKLIIDTERLAVRKNIVTTPYLDTFADNYVDVFNSIFRTPMRDETYEQ